MDKIQTLVASSFGSGFVVADYPYGFKLRTSIRYWVETKVAKDGSIAQRLVSQTVNPKNGRQNKPKADVYSPLVVIYLDGDRVESANWTYYDGKEKLEAFRDVYVLSEVQENFVAATLKAYAELEARRANGEKIGYSI